MPTGSDYNVAVVLVNRHEPEGEAAGRLIEIATEKGYDPRVVEAARGDHDVALSFRVPEDVAEEFNADRADRWPTKIENDDEKADVPPAAGVNEDAFAADQARSAHAAAVENAADDDGDPNTPPVRRSRTAAKNRE